MSTGTVIALGLTGAYNDLFSTQEERDNVGRTFVIDLDPARIDNFLNHPFKVRMDKEMERLVDSVREHGVLSPALVRPMPDGGYQMVSGHRRKRAAELAELPTLSCIVRELTDYEATIIMVDENKIALRPAVELSYLSETEQAALQEAISSEDCTPSHAQAIKMRGFSENGKLNPDVILSIMQEEKPNQVAFLLCFTTFSAPLSPQRSPPLRRLRSA